MELSCHHEVGNHLGVPANLQVLTGNLGISHLKPEKSAGKVCEFLGLV